MKHFTTMFFSALLMLLGGELFLPAYAQQPLAYESQPLPAQRQQQRTLQSVLKELEKEYQVNFTYQSDIVERKQVKQQDLLREQRNLDNILNELLNPLGLIYQKVDKNYYLIYPAENSQKVPKIDRENRSSTKDIPVIPDQYQPAVVRANPISIPLAQTISGQVTDLVS
ncbi:MAG: STN domain-containing protein, partial [Bacteroidota bacterium]